MDNAIKSVSLVFTFLILTPITLGISLFSLLAVSNTGIDAKTGSEVSSVSFLNKPRSGVRVYASLPITQPSISAQATASDARPAVLRQYLTVYGSPLIPYAEKIVQIADKYGLDYRLITAIAQQESNLCKIIPYDSYNCWGWGITGSSTLYFDSYDQAIETVTKGLKENYINKGYVTPDEIMTKYTPHSNGSWARGVNIFLADMEYGIN